MTKLTPFVWLADNDNISNSLRKIQNYVFVDLYSSSGYKIFSHTKEFAGIIVQFKCALASDDPAVTSLSKNNGLII